MKVGANFISMVKTNTKVFCKDDIEKITKEFPGGCYLLLSSKHMVPGGRTLISVVYKYNTRKVLYFIVTYNSVSTH